MSSLFSLWMLLASIFSTAPGEQWRLIDQDGTVEAFPLAPLLPEEQREAAICAWAWSDDAAPRRIEADRIGKEGLPVDKSRLKVYVPGAQALTDTRVIAGPVAMWPEVPEDLLPSWPVPREGRLAIPLDPGRPWRIRLAGKDRGTWWVDLPAGQAAVSLAPIPAQDLDLLVTGQDEKPLEGSSMRLLEGVQGRRGKARLWSFYRSTQGRISAPGLPGSEEIVAIVGAPDHVFAVLRGRPGDLPRRVRLDPGATVIGRFTDESGHPLAGVRVRLEAWISYDGPELAGQSAETADTGAWKVTALPAGEAVLMTQARGFAPVRMRLDLAEGRNDLGTMRLRRGKEFRVVVLDSLGAPVVGAAVAVGPVPSARTDPKGEAVLAVDPAEALDLEVRAPRYLPWKGRVEPGMASPMRIVMESAFTVTGRLLDPQGVPAGEGMAVLRRGSLSTSTSLEPGGGFELDLPPGVESELTLSSPATRELRIPLAAGAPGEVRDLGAMRAPAGVEIVGRLTSAIDGQPVAGAHVWLPRPSAEGQLLAWVDRDLLEATSAADGQFRLTGAPESVPLQMRIEAAGFARADLTVQAKAGALTVDVGDVTLGQGSTLRVVVPGSEGPGSEGEEATARADLRGDWLEMDMLTAPVRDGTAMLRNVPPGKVRVTVLRGRTLLCERDLTVLPDEDAEVECSGGALRVLGSVRMGGRPAGAGTLIWLPPALESPGRINNFTSAGGLRQQKVFGEGRPQVDVPVAEDGSFVTDDLTAGSWQVSWVPASGSLSKPQPVEIPDVPAHSEYSMVLTFPGGVLAGIVLDPDNRPAQGARVRDLGSGAVAFSGPDGAFVLTGTEPGTHSLQAERDELASPVVKAESLAGGAGDPVRLVLGKRQDPEIRIQALDTNQSPAPGSFVFLEEEGRGQRLLTTGSDGTVIARIDLPTPAKVRFAALVSGVWSLGAWTSWEDLPETVILLAGPSGSLRVESSARDGAPRILSPRGWDVGWLAARLGARQVVGPDHPLEMQGLPEGVYTILLEEKSSTVTVRAGHETVLPLD